MRKIINAPVNVPEEALEGFVQAHASDYVRVEGVKGVRVKEPKDKVALVIGGGSGHEPMFAMFVGENLADASANGNIFAERIGTMVVRYDKTTPDWTNNATYEIMYGDITGNPAYKAHMMRLQVEERYAVNSMGESVPIHEVAWGTKDDEPTHMVLQFTSSHGGAYIGSPGNSLWIDNVKLVY